MEKQSKTVITNDTYKGGVRFVTVEEQKIELPKPIELTECKPDEDITLVPHVDKETGLPVFQMGMKAKQWVFIHAFLCEEISKLENNGYQLKSTEEIIYSSLLYQIREKTVQPVQSIDRPGLEFFFFTHPEMCALNRFMKIGQLHLDEDEHGGFKHQVMICVNRMLSPHVKPLFAVK